MPRYAFLIEYHGRPFSGWQRQTGQASVQETLEAALAALDPEKPQMTGAGRTDAGVHARGQVAHADLSKDWDPFKLASAMNWHLRPHPVAVLKASPVPNEFHARFSAIERRYTYRVVARRAPLVLDGEQVWQVPSMLDTRSMREGGAYLIGRHDFTTFRSAMCQADSPVKTLDEITVEELPVNGGTEYRFHMRARSFLHNQVRSIVGTLERVGCGAWEPDRVAQALAARDRATCGPVAPPQGLCLTQVGYPANPFV